MRLQQQGAGRIRDEVGLPLFEETEFEEAGERRSHGLPGASVQLRRDLVLAARRAHDQAGVARDADVDGVIGRRVARMQRDEDVEAVVGAALGPVFGAVGSEFQARDPA